MLPAADSTAADNSAGDTAASIRERREHVLAGSYRLFYDEPVTVARALGVRITEVTGQILLDAYNNVPIIGHSDAEVAAAVAAELLRANTHTRYVDDAIVSYSESLLAHFPRELDGIAYTCSGSEANDLALQIARHATGAQGVIVTQHAYHGTTTAVREVSPSIVGLEGIADTTVTVSLGAKTLSPTERSDHFRHSVAQAIELLQQRGHGVAALLIDTAVTSDGIYAPADFVGQAAALVRERGGLVIADEVQAGFCRTGTWWGYEQAGFAPDLVTLGKPMGNGLPIAAVVSFQELFDRFGNEYRYFNTFAGTAAPIAAASVVLRRLEAMDAPEQVTALGERLRDGLANVFSARGVSVAVRGAGLMVGVDLDPYGDRASEAADEVRRLVGELRRGGVLVSHTGATGEVLKIRPPLSIQAEEIDEIVAAMAQACEAVFGGHPVSAEPDEHRSE